MLLEVGKVGFELLLKIEDEVVNLFGVGVSLGSLLLVDGELGELLDGVLLEKVAVELKLISDVLGVNLGE